MCLCLERDSFLSVLKVAQLLKGEEAFIDSKHNSGASRSLSLEACDLEDYTCSSYLKDLNRHRELVME